MASVDGGHMNCARCGRRLLTPSVKITTRAKAMSYGPVCARRMGLIEPRKASAPRIATRYMRVWEDPRQMELIA